MISPARAHETGTALAVLYGPFNRAGTPNRHTVQPLPTEEDLLHLTVDKIDGRRATGLIVYPGNDGEQTAGWLLGAGPGGLSKAGRKLNEGNAAAFGDFDSDGVRDVAVGDDGGRNDEDGDEIEPPSIHKTLTIHYGNGRRAVFKGTAGPAISGDFNGDSVDDLAFGGVVDSFWPHQYTSSRIFWGGTGGPRAGEKVKGVGLAAGGERLRR